MRKLVYWKRQCVFEAFEHIERLGWVKADYGDWPMNSFRFVEINATDDEFADRINGMIRI
jgi:hypothetical protein